MPLLVRRCLALCSLLVVCAAPFARAEGLDDPAYRLTPAASRTLKRQLKEAAGRGRCVLSIAIAPARPAATKLADNAARLSLDPAAGTANLEVGALIREVCPAGWLDKLTQTVRGVPQPEVPRLVAELTKRLLNRVEHPETDPLTLRDWWGSQHGDPLFAAYQERDCRLIVQQVLKPDRQTAEAAFHDLRLGLGDTLVQTSPDLRQVAFKSGDRATVPDLPATLPQATAPERAEFLLHQLRIASGQPIPTPQPKPDLSPPFSWHDVPPWAWLIGACGLTGFLWLGYKHVGPRRCRKCHRSVERVMWTDRTEHLSRGERDQELLGSVDTLVFRCVHCECIQKEHWRRMFSKYKKCPKCGFRTLTSYSAVAADSYDPSEGTAYNVTDCCHCAHHSEDVDVVRELGKAVFSDDD